MYSFNLSIKIFIAFFLYIPKQKPIYTSYLRSYKNRHTVLQLVQYNKHISILIYFNNYNIGQPMVDDHVYMARQMHKNELNKFSHSIKD